MEFTLTATIFSFFGWNVYLLIKKYREKMRQNYLQKLIDQESDYLIMNVAPYKKIKANEQNDKIVKPSQIEDAESSSDDYEIIQYRRRKTILDEVRYEKFQEQSYIQNSIPFDMLNIPSRQDRKQYKNNKDFSFTSQNQDIKQMKRFRKNSKINMDDSLPFDESPKQTNKNSSNKISEKKITQFEFSDLKDQFETQDSKQEQVKCVTDLIVQFESKKDNQTLEENKNVSIQLPVQEDKSNNQTKDQQNQQQEETLNIFGKFIKQALSQQKEKQQQEQKQLSPQQSQKEPEQKNIGLFSNLLKTTTPDLFPQKQIQPVQLNEISQVQISNLNNQFQINNNVEQQQQQQQQHTSLFQNSLQNNNSQIPIINLNNQNQDSLNKNCSNDTKQSSVIQNNTPSNFTFGINSNNQTNSQIGLFDNLINKNGGLFGNLTTTTNICQDQTNNKSNLFSSQPQLTQNNLIQNQPNNQTSLFGNILSTQQPKEQNQQSQTGGLFNFSSNTQTGSNLFSNLKKN